MQLLRLYLEMGNKWLAAQQSPRKDSGTKKRRKKSTTKTITTTESSSSSAIESLSKCTTLAPPPPPVTCFTSSSPGLSHAYTPTETASERKLTAAQQAKDDFDADDDNKSSYILMDTGIMCSVFGELVKYPRCEFAVEINHCVENKQGLAHEFHIKCKSISCRWLKKFFSSKEATREGRGSKPFDINLNRISIINDQRGNPPRKKLRQTYVNLQQRLHWLCSDHADGIKTMEEFLSGIGHTIHMV